MNIVLGIERKDGPETESRAASLLQRLRVSNATIEVVDVLSPLEWKNGGQGMSLSAKALEQVQSSVRETAEEAARCAAESIRQDTSSDCAEPYRVRARVREAPCLSAGLLAQAEESQAGLIAIDAPHHGLIGALFSDSVACALVIGAHTRSLLLARKPAAARLPAPKPLDHSGYSEALGSQTDRPLRVVFATDHSHYANDCVRVLLEIAPRGISHLTVMTAYPDVDVATMGHWLSGLTVHPETPLQHALRTENEDTLRRLAPLLGVAGATSESRVVAGEVNDAIAKTMYDTRANLLILGARGHGFVKPLTAGSVAFHQAMAAPYSVLILRNSP